MKRYLAIFIMVFSCAFICGSIVAQETAKPKEERQSRRRPWTLFNWLFHREIGLINVANPPKEMASALSLEECINIAVSNHLPLQIAEKSVALGKRRVIEARRNLLPSAMVAYEDYYGRIFGRRFIGRKQYIEGQQPIFHGGELYYNLKQTETNLEVVKQDYTRIKNELILQVKKGYYSFAKAKENAKVQEQLAQEVEKIYEMAIKEADAGVISKLELLNVTSQESQVKYQLASAEGDESIAELILKQAMNIDPNEKIDVKPNPSFKKIQIDYEESLRAAYTNRAEIKINSLMIDYYNYGKRIANAKDWPKIDFLGSWGMAKEEYLSIDNGPKSDGTTDPDQRMEQQYYYGIKASLPFWGSTTEYSFTREHWVPVVSAYHGTDTSTNALKVKLLDKMEYASDKLLADIDYDRARQELTKIKQDITLEVKEGVFSYEKALMQLETASKKVRYQEKDLELTRLKRGMDEAQDSNVIEGMIKLAQEKFGYMQAVTDCYISAASVNKAIGVDDYFKVEEDLQPK